MQPSLPQQEMILVVDDERDIAKLLQEVMTTHGWQALTVASLAEARQALGPNPGLAAVLCDQLLPDGDGLAFFKELKSGQPDAVRILITGHPDTNLALSAINEGEIFRFITKPFVLEEVVVAVRDGLERRRLVLENRRLQQVLLRSNEALQKSNDLLQQALSSSVKFGLEIIDRFDHMLASHSGRVTKWALEMGKVFTLSEPEMDTLEIAAQMHDIGLVSVSPSYHNQQQTGWAGLPLPQQTALQSHPKTGAELLQFLHQKGVPEIVLSHHEWFNGNGYPRRLAQEGIPLLSAIIAVPDAYDEIPLERKEAAKFVEENLGVRFHPETGRAFLRILDERPEYSRQEREVLISELEPDMTLTSNLMSPAGMMLVPKGAVLSARAIQYIRSHDESDPITQRIFVAK